MYLINSAHFWVLALYLEVYQHLPSNLEMFQFVPKTSKKDLVHGALIESEILTSPLPMYLLNLAWIFGTSAVPAGASTPHKWSRNVCMCLKNLQKYLVHGAPIEAKILTSPCICSMWPSFGYWHSAHSCVKTSKVGYKCFFMCLRNLQKIWYMPAQWEVNTTQFQWCPDLTPQGSISQHLTPGCHVPAHRGTHCGLGQTSQLLIESHGPNYFWDTASSSLMLHLAGIQSTVNANGWQDGCFTG